MYKRKDRKVNPVDLPLPHGECPVGSSPSNVHSPHAGKVVPRGSRLTPKRLERVAVDDGMLSSEERQLFLDLLFEFEGAIAFEDSEMGLLDERIEPPVKAYVVPHVPWQQQNLRLPKAMQDVATSIVKEKLELGLLERSQGPYRSRYFLVAKKAPGAWRFINDVQPFNRVTIRDAGLPPAVDDFSEDFAGFPIVSSLDFYSGYNQILLDPSSRDMTAFLTSLGLLRQTRLPQGWTNSVAVFQRIISKVLYRHIPHRARPFLDDVGVRGPKNRYDEELVAPGIRRFVMEHASILREVFRDVWMSGLTVAGDKLALGMSRIDIVGMVCDEEGRHPERRKVQKIVDWPVPRSVTDVRAFLGLCTYYRIFVPSFSVVAAPIIELLRKSEPFAWNPRRQKAMDSLKSCLASYPTLMPLDFSPAASPIVLTTDASQVGWGAVLQQAHNDDLLHPARYESGVWSVSEAKYDPVKLEYRGLLRALRKFRFWLYGRSFMVQTDAQTLVWLLNQPPNDLPNALLTRWLAYIRLFDFEVKHIPGRTNGAADGLSRRGASSLDPPDDDDIDGHFDAFLYALAPTDSAPLSHVWFDETKYEDDGDLLLGRFLISLVPPKGFSDLDYRKLRRRSQDFFVYDGFLFRRGRRGCPPRRVVGLKSEREEVLQGCHEEAGHRGKVGTFENVRRKYQWRGLFEDCARYAQSCMECQLRSRVRYEEPLHPTWTCCCFQKVGVDVVHMPKSNGYRYIVFARDDFSGWLEGRPLTSATASTVAKFLYEEVITRHGCPENIVFDGGAENRGEVETLLRALGISRIRISAYHPQSNGLVERGHRPLVDSLSKYAHGQRTEWRRCLSLALWADRISVRRSTGFSAFRFVYGRDCLLPVDLSVVSWGTIDWGRVKTREELIAARMQQLDH